MPRVTECLSIIDRYGGVDRATLQRAAELGTLVHAHCLGYLRGLFMPCPENILPWVESFQEWADMMVDEVFAVEEELTDEHMQLVGHVDAIVHLKKHDPGHYSVIDLKRVASIDWCVKLQLAAYQHLAEIKWPKTHFTYRYALHARPDNRMHLIDCKDGSAWAGFISAFTLFNLSKKGV